MSKDLISLPTEPVVVEKVEPVVLIIYGATKVGKTAALADLPKNLIFDLERGAESYECLRVRIDTYGKFYQACEELKKPHEYKFLTIDTLDRLVEWLEERVVAEWNGVLEKQGKKDEFVTSYTEIPFGKGYDLVRIKMRTWINYMRKLVPNLILVGHLKRTIIGDTSIEVKEDNLDLVGKLRNLVCADADAVGYVFRGKEGENPALRISFKASEATAAGSRLAHLRGDVFTLSEMVKENEYKTYWEKIYKI